MKNENKSCYETAEHNLFTRFETDSKGDFLLPYSGLLFVRLAPASEGEILTLIYVTHTVTIMGSTLSALLPIIQKGRTEIIRCAGHAGGSTNAPAIHNIIITEGADKQDGL